MQSTLNLKVDTKQFEHQSVLHTSIESVQRFHANPDALSQLTPFPIIVQPLRDERESLTKGELEFSLWFGTLPVRWVARHEPIPDNDESFADIMVEGPMALWEHQHIIREHEHGVELIDRVTLAHKSGWRGWLTRLFFDGLPLRFLFLYRHWRTKRATSSG